MTTSLSDRQRSAIVRITGLTILNAMVFQEVLAGYDSRVKTLRQLTTEADRISAFISHWEFIIKHINYFPIFHVGREALLVLSNDPDVIQAVDDLVERALRIVGWRAALRHDLMGRIFHVLLAEAKFLGAFYTSIPAATILLKLALDPSRWTVDWANLDDVQDLRICDLACGTGTLLMAAADAMADNYVKACIGKGQEVDLGILHKKLLEDIIWGFDVVPSAVHLTASTLAIQSPATAFDRMNLFSLPLGGVFKRLGSIEFLAGDTIRAVADLFGTMDVPERVAGTGTMSQIEVRLPKLDLCVMNPPFTRSTIGNLLFGSLPEGERRDLQKHLAHFIRGKGASTTAGLGSVFVAVADKHIKAGGRIALVLPKALLSGVAWNKTRTLLGNSYHLEWVIVSYEPKRWNFSENTNLSECLIVARKLLEDEDGSELTTTAVNLWKNPGRPVEALAVVNSLLRTNGVPDVISGQGAFQLKLGSMKYGEALSLPWQQMKNGNWLLPCAFAQSELVRVTHLLLSGQVALPGYTTSSNIPTKPLVQVADVGPDARDVMDGFDTSTGSTPYAAVWGHKAELFKTLSAEPNIYLEPLTKARPGRNLKKVMDVWPKAGSLLISRRSRLNTKSLMSILVSKQVLSDVWWPLSLIRNIPDEDKVLALWFNSTLGILPLLAYREDTEGAWVQFKKAALLPMPVLDVASLPTPVVATLASAFDRLATQELLPFPMIDRDPVRKEIDSVFSSALGLPELAKVREMLSREPIVCLKSLL
jgi:hypothetical protein